MGMALNAVRVLGAGALSALATAFLAALIYSAFEYDIFSLTWPWDWAPIGALMCGGLAVTGLYAACILLDLRANHALRVLFLFIGALAYVLTYLIQFWLVRDRLLPGTDFADYFELVVTTEGLSVQAMHRSLELGTMGPLGYPLAAIRFLAASLGGLIGYRILKDRPWCERCGQFKRLSGGREYYFADAQTYRFFRTRTDELLAKPTRLSRHLAQSSPKLADAAGIYWVSATLLRCRKCGAQVLEESVEAHDGESWHLLLDEGRVMELPDGADFSAIFTLEGAAGVTGSDPRGSAGTDQ